MFGMDHLRKKEDNQLTFQIKLPQYSTNQQFRYILITQKLLEQCNLESQL